MYYSFYLDGNVDSSVSDAITAGAIIHPLTQAIVTDPVEVMQVILSRALNPIILAYPNSLSASKKSLEDAAKANYDAALFPLPVTFAQFEIQGPSNPSVAHGSSIGIPIDLLFLDPAYAGTITFSVAFANSPITGVTFSAFSPTTLAAPGISTVTVTVGGGVAAQPCNLIVTATDGTLTCRILVALNIT